MEILSFRLGAEEYGVEISAVREVRPHAKASPFPVVDLRQRLRIAASAERPASAMIVLALSAGPLAILVDQVSDMLRLGASEMHLAAGLDGRTSGDLIQGFASRGERMVIVLRAEKLAAQAA